MRNILITGGGVYRLPCCQAFVNKYPDYHIVNLDKLTYAGNLANLKDIETRPNYTFVRADIADLDEMRRVIREYEIDGIIHLAAESHVDRSIKDPFTFARTNVMGTLALLQAAKEYWESLPERYEGKRFYHISTDEVYGALELTHPEGVDAPFSTKPRADRSMRRMASSSSRRRRSIIPIPRILHRRLRPTILFEPIMTLTACRRS